MSQLISVKVSYFLSFTIKVRTNDIHLYIKKRGKQEQIQIHSSVLQSTR